MQINVPEVGRYTDRGPRSHNEDASWIPERDRLLPPEKGYLYIVADGVGGRASGEVASRLAVETVPKQYYDDPNPDVRTCLRQAIHAANRVIHQQADLDPTRTGMASTLTAAVICHGRLYTANVGDSRVYLIRDGQATQLTEDHTWVNEQLKAGILTPKQAENHSQKNIVLRSLGHKVSVEVDVSEAAQLQFGDSIILCSDGLSGVVSGSEMAAAVGTRHSAAETAQMLIDLALRRGTTDNATCVVAYINMPILAVGTRQRDKIKLARKGLSLLWPAASLVLLLVVVAVAALILNLRESAQTNIGSTVSVAEAVIVVSATETPTDVPTSILLTPTNSQAAAAAVVVNTPTVEPDQAQSTLTSTPAVIYDRPQIVAPAQNQVFQAGQPITLRWQTNRPLGENEQFLIALSGAEAGLINTKDWLIAGPAFEISAGLAPDSYIWLVQLTGKTDDDEEIQEFTRSEIGHFIVAAVQSTSTQAPATPTLEPVYGQLTLVEITDVVSDRASFNWVYDAPLLPGQTFEVRVWGEGEPPQGIHDAQSDYMVRRIEALSNGRYRLVIDIRDAPPIMRRPGDYFWTVWLVQAQPDYHPLGAQAEPPGRFRFEIDDRAAP